MVTGDVRSEYENAGVDVYSCAIAGIEALYVRPTVRTRIRFRQAIMRMWETASFSLLHQTADSFQVKKKEALDYRGIQDK